MKWGLYTKKGDELILCFTCMASSLSEAKEKLSEMSEIALEVRDFITIKQIK